MIDLKFYCVVVSIISLTSIDSKLIRHTFVIEYFSGFPDGVYKEKILGINGQFPGPLIEAYIGDTLQVDVINRIQDFKILLSIGMESIRRKLHGKMVQPTLHNVH